MAIESLDSSCSWRKISITFWCSINIHVFPLFSHNIPLKRIFKSFGRQGDLFKDTTTYGLWNSTLLLLNINYVLSVSSIFMSFLLFSHNIWLEHIFKSFRRQRDLFKDTTTYGLWESTLLLFLWWNISYVISIFINIQAFPCFLAHNLTWTYFSKLSKAMRFIKRHHYIWPLR